MISTKIIKAKGFWKSVFIFSLVFIIVTNAIRIGIRYQFNLEKFVATELSDNHIFMFFISNVLLWFVLGFVLTYLNFKKNLQERN